MQMRRLGKDGPLVSAIGLGCMRMSMPPSALAEDEGIATIEAALDAGIKFLITGDFYGMGHNEMLVGRAIRHRRDEAVISVKFGAMKAPSGAILGVDCRPAAVKNFAAYSLQRLGIEVIDLYQPGRADPTVPIEDTVGAIADLIQEGKVRYLGLSEVNAEQLQRAHAIHPVAALEIEYSLATRFIEAKILPTARALGIGVVAYSVVTQGLLTGAIGAGLAPDDPRRRMPRFHDENLPRNLATVAALRDMAAARGCTPAQLAIAWVLSRGEDIVPLVGMSRRTRLPENLAAMDIAPDTREFAELDRIFAPGAIRGERQPAQVRPLSAD